MVSSPLFEIQDIAFERDDQALFAGLSASLCGGDILQVSGPNGCGKTTLLHILATLKSPSKGQLLWRGQTTRGNSSYLSELAFVGHQPGVKLALSGRENLSWYTRLYHPPKAPDSTTQRRSAAPPSIDHALDKAGLKTRKDLPCNTYSAGQLRRVALASLYLRGATLWLLDEPLTALDSDGISDLEALFNAHLSDGGMIIFSSHQALSLTQVRHLALADYSPGMHC